MAFTKYIGLGIHNTSICIQDFSKNNYAMRILAIIRKKGFHIHSVYKNQNIIRFNQSSI